MNKLLHEVAMASGPTELARQMRFCGHEFERTGASWAGTPKGLLALGLLIARVVRDFS